MKYLVETKEKSYIFDADDYSVEENYIDFKKFNGLFAISVAYFKISDVIRIIGKEKNQNKDKQISKDEKEPK